MEDGRNIYLKISLFFFGLLKLTHFHRQKIKTTSFDTRPTSTSKVFNSTPHLITLASVHQPTQSDPTSTFLTRLLLSISNYTQQ